MASEPQIASPVPGRIASIDAYRGFVMLLLLGEALHFENMAEKMSDNRLIHFFAYHQTHVEWVGCSLHDLIQPSFSFLVGVALPFSIASRTAHGQSRLQMLRHAFWRALILILLGIFLRSMGQPQTNFTFEDTLTQIGLGYGFLFLLGLYSTRIQWIALAAVLAGYWLAFALYPLPPADFDTRTVGVPQNWSHNLSGFAAHWNKNTNFASNFEVWFLNLFPRETPFTFNDGGYLTLSFIPTLGTMILGLLAGSALRSDRRTKTDKARWLVLGGVALLLSGALLGWLGICPVVKRIWTPSWTLFSGGWCFLFLAGFYYLLDARERRKWAFPLLVPGMNSITAYCMSWGVVTFFKDALVRHFGHGPFQLLGANYEPLLLGLSGAGIAWLILWWMYRNRIFLCI
jgi:predicted acyltransferase